jgi:hypothetical protein
MRRTVLVGDVHGCRDELLELLDRVGLGDDDRLVLVGDLVARGPDSRGTLDLLMRLGARSVRGNHEDKLLRIKDDPKAPAHLVHRAVAATLDERHWDYLASLPLWIDLPTHGARVVHAGLVPGVPVELQAPRTLMYARCLGSRGEPIERREGRLWGEAYEGPPHVAFGHNAMDGLQLHRWATGLDTAAVYGGRLTAMVLDDGVSPPPPEDRPAVLVSVPARRRYWEG